MERKEIDLLIKHRDFESLKNFRFKESDTNIFLLITIMKKMNTDPELTLSLLSLKDINVLAKVPRKLFLIQRNDWQGMFPTTLVGNAIKNDDIKILEKLYKLKADFSFKTNVKYNYLTYAIEKNSFNSIKFLIDKFPDLITQETVNGENNIFYMVSNKKMTPFIKEVINKTNYDIGHTTTYNTTLLDEAIDNYNKNNFDLVTSIYSEREIAKQMSKQNYKLLWKCLYNKVDGSSLKKITDILSKDKNLEHIIHKEKQLNFYEMCICYTKTSILQQYDFKIKSDFTKILFSPERIIELYDSPSKEDFTLKNLDSNLLYIIKNKLIEVDIGKNFRFNPYAVGLIKTGNYFYKNELKFKNIKADDLIKMVFKSLDYSLMDYKSLYSFIELINSNKKLNAENSYFILNNAQYGCDNEVNKVAFAQYINSITHLIFHGYISNSIKIEDSRFFCNAFLIANLDKNYLDNKNSKLWQTLFKKGFECDTLNASILCDNALNILYGTSINSETENFILDSFEKIPMKFFKTDLTPFESYNMPFIKSVCLLSKSKWKEFIANQRNNLLDSLEIKQENKNDINKKRRI